MSAHPEVLEWLFQTMVPLKRIQRKIIALSQLTFAVFSRRAKKKMNLLYTMGEEPDRPEFVSSLIELLSELGLAQHKVPLIDRTRVDLFQLYNVVQLHGGFVEAQKSVSWLEIAESVGITDPTMNMVKYLKSSYIRLLLPYEARYDCGGVDPVSLIEAGRIVAESPEYRERNRDKLLPVPVKPDKSQKRKREPSPPRNEFGWFICDLCQAERGPDGAAPTFTRMQSFVRHKHDKHGEAVISHREDKFSCHEEDCRFTSHRPEQMVTHLGDIHKLSGFTISQEEFRTGKELHEWKLQKLEATSSALLNYSWNSQFVSSINGTKTCRENCFRNPRRESAPARVKYPRCKDERTGVVRTDCPAFMKIGLPIVSRHRALSYALRRPTSPNDRCPTCPKADYEGGISFCFWEEMHKKEICFLVGSLKPGSPRIKVQYCLTHYGHNPQEDVARVQRRLTYLKKRGPKLLDVDDSLAFIANGKMLSALNCAEIKDNLDDNMSAANDSAEVSECDTMDQYSVNAMENNGTIPDYEPIPLPVFEPIPLTSFEVENSVDPDTGRLNGESVEIHRCHASIVLALKDIAASGAEETLTELQDLERRAVVARAKVIHSEKMADEELDRRNAKENKRKRRWENYEERKKKLRSFLTGDGVRIYY